MTYPRAKALIRKVSNTDARLIRHDYATRKLAELMVVNGKRLLETTPTPIQHAKRLGVHHTRAYAIARGLAYKDVAGA
jgi:hypothetical protein